MTITCNLNRHIVRYLSIYYLFIYIYSFKHHKRILCGCHEYFLLLIELASPYYYILNYLLFKIQVVFTNFKKPL